MGLEPRGLHSHEPVAPRHWRDETLVAEMLRPVLGDDVEEIESQLPMLGVLIGHEPLERGQVHLLALDEVHQPRQIRGEIGGLRRSGHERPKAVDVADLLGPERSAPSQDETHQCKSPRQRSHCGHPCASLEIMLRARLGAEDQRRVLVGIAQRPDARK